MGNANEAQGKIAGILLFASIKIWGFVECMIIIVMSNESSKLAKCVTCISMTKLMQH